MGRHDTVAMYTLAVTVPQKLEDGIEQHFARRREKWWAYDREFTLAPRLFPLRKLVGESYQQYQRLAAVQRHLARWKR